MGLLANVRQTQGSYAAAERLYHRARGRATQGEPWARRSVEIRERALGSDHPAVAADKAALGAEHPHTGICREGLAAVRGR
ncbi:MAG: tetratricopeptide repeat protein [Thermoanaerobaculia bacterium]